jgi:UDP-2,4-diacetamido-2,4,6-trideoxy-beta-L-altropyranose hydrolase
VNIAIRADASVEIGAGHVMRCLTLAGQLRSQGADCVFVCREHDGHLCDIIEKKGFSVCRLAASREGLTDDCPAHAGWLGTNWRQDAQVTVEALERHGAKDLMIVDHYALDHRWERWISGRGMRIAVMDDLADRSHDCHVLIDQNCLPGQEARYADLLPRNCVTLFGSAFALIRTEFQTSKGLQRPRDGTIARILVFFGSADSADYTSRVLGAIGELDWPALQVDVVTGAANPRKEAIARLCGQDGRFSYYCQVANMAQLMAAADLAISAGGFTSYELAYMGVPSILFPLSSIQEQVSAELASRGVAISLGHTKTFPEDEFRRALRALLGSPLQCTQMARAGEQLFDGLGAKRVAEILISG